MQPITQLPTLLSDLKHLLPKLKKLPKLIDSRTAPPRLIALLPAVEQLLELLPLLPELNQQERCSLPANYNPLDNIPPPNDLMPELTVNAKGKAYLSQELIAKLNLRAGQPIDLIPPNSTRTPFWHLDLRPSARRNVAWYPDTRPRISGVWLPEGLLHEGELLALRLVPGEPEFAGFYPLLPAGPPAARPKKGAPTLVEG